MTNYWFSFIVSLDFFQIDDFFPIDVLNFRFTKVETDIDYNVMNKFPIMGISDKCGEKDSKLAVCVGLWNKQHINTCLKMHLWIIV